MSMSAADALLDRELTVTELADLLDILARHCRRLAADGVLPEIRRGRFRLGPAVRSYFVYVASHSDVVAGGPRADMLLTMARGD